MRVLALVLALVLAAAPAHALRRRSEDGPSQARLRRANDNLQQLFFGQALLREARRHLGTPYVWGAKDGKEGFDCSGYTHFVYTQLGVELPANSLGQYSKGIPIERPALMPGDLVFFASTSAPLHVGIYEGGGKFLNAPSDGKLVCEADMEKGYFADRYIGARRFPPGQTAQKENTP